MNFLMIFLSMGVMISGGIAISFIFKFVRSCASNFSTTYLIGKSLKNKQQNMAKENRMIYSMVLIPLSNRRFFDCFKAGGLCWDWSPSGKKVKKKGKNRFRLLLINIYFLKAGSLSWDQILSNADIWDPCLLFPFPDKVYFDETSSAGRVYCCICYTCILFVLKTTCLTVLLGTF